MASNLKAMASNLEAMASNLKAMASNLEAMAFKPRQSDLFKETFRTLRLESTRSYTLSTGEFDTVYLKGF